MYGFQVPPQKELLNRPEEFPAVHTPQGPTAVTLNSRTGDYSDSDSDSDVAMSRTRVEKYDERGQHTYTPNTDNFF